MNARNDSSNKETVFSLFNPTSAGDFDTEDMKTRSIMYIIYYYEEKSCNYTRDTNE